MQTMITHSQKSPYGRSQISDVQKKRLSARPMPLMIAHQPEPAPEDSGRYHDPTGAHRKAGQGQPRVGEAGRRRSDRLLR
jgi:hypothetical protein